MTMTLTIFGCRIAALSVQIDEGTAAAVQPVVGGAVKRVSRRWAARMMS